MTKLSTINLERQNHLQNVYIQYIQELDELRRIREARRASMLVLPSSLSSPPVRTRSLQATQMYERTEERKYLETAMKQDHNERTPVSTQDHHEYVGRVSHLSMSPVINVLKIGDPD